MNVMYRLASINELNFNPIKCKSLSLFRGQLDKEYSKLVSEVIPTLEGDGK